MRLATTCIAIIAALPLFAACADTTAPVAPPADTTVRAFVVSGNNQSVSASSEATDTLVARFTTASGAPIPGTAVRWTLDGEGEIAALSTTTDTDGVARAIFRAGTKVGDFGVTATARAAEAPFQVTVAAAPAARIEAMKVALDTLEAEGLFSGAAVRVSDEFGNPVAGSQLQVAIYRGDETETDRHFSVAADANGVAQLRDVTLLAGENHVVYTLGGMSARYVIVVMATPAASRR